MSGPTLVTPAQAEPITPPRNPEAAPAADSPPEESVLASLAVRLGLQRRAARNLQRHFRRAIRRVGALMLADIAALQFMRLVLRSIRNEALLGSSVAATLQDRLPAGYLGGWQFAAALIIGLYVTGNYSPGDYRRDPARLFLGCALAIALPLWLSLWTDGFGLVLFQYAVTVLLVWGGIAVERLMMDRLVARVLPRPRATPALLVGNAADCRATAQTPAFARGDEFRLMGFVDLHSPPASDAAGGMFNFARLLHKTRAEAVVICGYLSDPHLHDVVGTALSAGCEILSIPRSVTIAGVQPGVVWKNGQPLVQLTSPGLKGWQLVLKRLVDLVGASAMLLVLGPLMLIIAAAIRLDDGAPILFKQVRIGSGGRRFNVWKFRTMRNDSSDAAHRELVMQMLRGEEVVTGHQTEDGNQIFKLVDDPRVTRVGAILRRTSLDELPQLFNVLRGEMSLVGPRPPLLYEFEAYDHWQYDRLQVLPGITGLWQVSGRNLLTYRQMCELDVQYVRNWSLYLDFKILLKTIPVVLFNSGRAA
ncbi:MAG: sugar transferase [Gemmatimonadales bacterium]